MSVYKTLKWVVECKPSWQAFFEPIAAFNVDSVAMDYALKCSVAAAGRSEYRVAKYNSNGKRAVVKG